MNSNRHLRRGSRRPCRGCLFNIARVCRKTDSTRHLRTGSTRPCRGCLFNTARACAGKWTLTDTFEEAQHGLVEGGCSILPEPAQENELPRTPSRRVNTALSKVSDHYSSSPCRKMDSNRHLRSGLARPCRRCPCVCSIFPEPVQENGF